MLQRSSARLVNQKRGRVSVDTPLITPMHECDEGGGKIGSLGGEAVVVPDWAILIGDSGHDSVIGETLEAVGQEITGYT